MLEIEDYSGMGKMFRLWVNRWDCEWFNGQEVAVAHVSGDRLTVAPSRRGASQDIILDVPSLIITNT